MPKLRLALFTIAIASRNILTIDWQHSSRMLDNQHRQTGLLIGATYENAVKNAAKSRSEWPWKYKKYDRKIKQQRNTISEQTANLRKQAREVATQIHSAPGPISKERAAASRRAMNAYHDADTWRKETLSRGTYPRRASKERAAMLVKHADYVNHSTGRRWANGNVNGTTR